jgi:hypothetical protein
MDYMVAGLVSMLEHKLISVDQTIHEVVAAVVEPDFEDISLDEAEAFWEAAKTVFSQRQVRHSSDRPRVSARGRKLAALQADLKSEF